MFKIKFDPKTFKPFLNGPEPQKHCSKYFFLQNYLNICRVIWESHEGLVCQIWNFVYWAVRKQKNWQTSPSQGQYFTNIFFSLGSSQIFAAVLFNWTLTFSHPSASLPELQLILVKILCSLCEASHLVPNIWKKVKWQNVVTQIFLSEIISTTENGGGGNSFCQILNFPNP